jgi:hypothetical protein
MNVDYGDLAVNWPWTSPCIVNQAKLLDFKLSPCFICNMFSFECFPGVWVLIADVSEPSISSIFIGRSMQYGVCSMPMKMEPIEGSETSAISTQAPGKHPKENILQAKLFELCAISVQIMLTQTKIIQYKICTHSLEHAQYKYENTFRVAM